MSSLIVANWMITGILVINSLRPSAVKTAITILVEKICTINFFTRTMHAKMLWTYLWYLILTHWGWVMHTCIGNLTIIGSHNGLSPGRHQVIIWTNANILLIGPLGTNFSEILIQENAFENLVWIMAAILSRPQCVKWNPKLVLSVTGVTLAGIIFPFTSYHIVCHPILLWKILQYKMRSVICYLPFRLQCYVWDAVNMQTQKVSKVSIYDSVERVVVYCRNHVSYYHIYMYKYQCSFARHVLIHLNRWLLGIYVSKIDINETSHAKSMYNHLSQDCDLQNKFWLPRKSYFT